MFSLVATVLPCLEQIVKPDSTVMADSGLTVSQSVSQSVIQSGQQKGRKCSCVQRAWKEAFRWLAFVALLLFSLLLPSSFGRYSPLYALSSVTSSHRRACIPYRSPSPVALLHQSFSFFCRYFNQTANAIKVSHRN